MKSKTASLPQSEWNYPKLKIKPPPGAITSGFPELPDGMLAWTNRKNKYTVLVCGYYSDLEARKKEWWDKATEGMLPHEIDSEYLCSSDSRGGQKAFPWLESHPEKFTKSYENYRRGSVWTIPNHWHLIGGLDYGSRNPTSFHIYAFDEFKNCHSVFEYYQPSHYAQIAEVLLSHPLYPRLIKICLDPSAFNRNQSIEGKNGAFTSIAELLESEGVAILERANNNRIAGLARVVELFNQRPGEERPSKFFISTDCPNQFQEFVDLIYMQESQLQLMHKNPSEDVEGKNDHSFDDAKYGMLGWDSEAERDPWKNENEFSLSAIEEEIEEYYDDVDAGFI